MNKEELKIRTKKFAVSVFKFIETLEESKATGIISYQLLKSSSSVAANYRATCRGKSDADFLNKLKVVDEEADESLFWLELISELNYKCDFSLLNFLIQEASEIVAIFSASIKTLKSKNLVTNITNSKS